MARSLLNDAAVVGLPSAAGPKFTHLNFSIKIQLLCQPTLNPTKELLSAFRRGAGPSVDLRV